MFRVIACARSRCSLDMTLAHGVGLMNRWVLQVTRPCPSRKVHVEGEPNDLEHRVSTSPSFARLPRHGQYCVSDWFGSRPSKAQRCIPREALATGSEAPRLAASHAKKFPHWLTGCLPQPSTQRHCCVPGTEFWPCTTHPQRPARHQKRDRPNRMQRTA
jgi:hypothetical protein